MLKAKPNFLKVQRYVVQPKAAAWSLVNSARSEDLLVSLHPKLYKCSWASNILIRWWVDLKKWTTFRYVWPVHRTMSSRNHMSLSYIQKWPNKPIAYSCFCHLPQRQAGQGDKYTQKNQPAAKGQQGPAPQRCQLCCQQITARGSAKKDELLKFPTSSLFCDLYWKVILYWTSWTVSQA